MIFDYFTTLYLRIFFWKSLIKIHFAKGFKLMSEDIFDKNVAAFNARNPHFITRLNLGELPDDLFLVDGKKGKPTLKARDENGEYYLHSAYDPIREMNQVIDREVNQQEENKENRIRIKFFIVIGMGLGYCFDSILPRLEKNQKMILVQPSKKDFFMALKSRDFSEFISNEAVSIFVDERSSDAAYGVAQSVYSINAVNWKIILHPALFRRYFGFCKDFVLQLRGRLFSNRVLMNTEIGMGHLFSSNIIRNIPDISMSSGVNEFDGKWRGKPVIVISAGPSLDKQLPLLEKYRNKVLMVAVGSAWKSLSMAGIEPHIVAAVDPQDLSQKSFEGQVCKGNWLLADTATNRGVVKGFSGKKIFSSSYDAIDDLIELISERKGVLSGGGTVSHIAFNFAIRMGANPIILVGQDLAYTNNITHTQFHFLRDHEGLNEELVDVPGYYGGKVKTNVQMDVFRLTFEDIISVYPDIEFINATEGGARIEGAEQRSLQDVLESLSAEETIDPDDLWSCLNSNINHTQKALNVLLDWISHLNDAKDIAEDIVDTSKKLKMKWGGDDFSDDSCSIELERLNLQYLYDKFRELDPHIKWLIESFTGSSRYGVLQIIEEMDEEKLHQDQSEGENDIPVLDIDPDRFKALDLNIGFYQDTVQACKSVISVLDETVEVLRKNQIGKEGI
ncbi:motility associated factor glycosyltransferase family protein [Ectothiorhodospira lacustris]|uniref:motility associated factor glycosyltransferase family protein n=1 Tax=Ectothiorhodospira lacustris TaxID=2899127 RepID=UPI001EE80401|nr:6-hydroxymethylpterin diphosphokinase MptE-like protein [Ectothiorhodospira lacustris]MCG5501469.1 DUF115 domain-containing protein [Ectothiorhodospira lacustris]